MMIIGIAGGTGSGKTTVVRKIMQRLPQGEVEVISQDSYYKDSSHVPVEERQKINFDEPAAFDWPLLIEHLKALKLGHAVESPTYSYLTCTRQPETVHVNPCDVVLVEGILVLSDDRLRDMFDIKPGDSLIILCDINQGMAIVKSDIIESIGDEIFKAKQEQEKEGE